MLEREKFLSRELTVFHMEHKFYSILLPCSQSVLCRDLCTWHADFGVGVKYKCRGE